MKLSTIGISVTSLSLLFLASCSNFERMCMNAGGTMEKMNVSACPSFNDSSSVLADSTATIERPLVLATAFGGSGINHFNFGASYDDFATTLLKPSTGGKLIAVGLSNVMWASSVHKFVSVLRVDATTGYPDPTFAVNPNQDGRGVYIDTDSSGAVTGDAYATADGPDGVGAVLTAQGRIAVGFTHVPASTPADTNLSIMAFAADGSLSVPAKHFKAPKFDANYYPYPGVDPANPTVSSSHEYLRAVALDKNNRVMLMGETDAYGGETRIALLRLMPETLELDNTFAVDNSFGGYQDTFSGYSIIRGMPNGGSVHPRAMVLDSTGRIYIAGTGTATGATISKMFLIRLDANGYFDSTFNPPDLGMGLAKNDEGLALSLDASGNILLGGLGTNAAGTQTDLAMIRLLPASGALDTTFGVGGHKRYPLGTQSGKIRSLTQQGSKILALGQVGTATVNVNQMLLVRFNSDGSVDTTFGTSGEMRFDNSISSVAKNALGFTGLWDGSAFYFAGFSDRGVATGIDFTIGKLN